VVLDANVLFPASLRDILLRCAEKGLYRLRLSEEIWGEVVRNLIGTGRLTPEKAARLDAAIRSFLRRTRALVTDYEPLIPTLTNHPKDRHVLAVAVRSGAHIIVTVNLKDFPSAALAPFSIVAEHPDPFLARLYRAHPDILQQVVRDQAADLRNPPLTVADVLDALMQHIPATVNLLRAAMENEGNGGA